MRRKVLSMVSTTQYLILVQSRSTWPTLALPAVAVVTVVAHLEEVVVVMEEVTEDHREGTEDNMEGKEDITEGNTEEGNKEVTDSRVMEDSKVIQVEDSKVTKVEEVMEEVTEQGINLQCWPDPIPSSHRG